MERVNKVQSGILKVSEDVITTIVKLATLEVDGVHSLACANCNYKGILGKFNNGSTIRIRLVGDVVEISVGIIVKAGNNVVRLAETIQENIKSNVQTMTGITVARVNVNIHGIVFDDVKTN